MYRAIQNKKMVIAAPQTSTYHIFAMVPTDAVLAQTLVVIDSEDIALWGLLSSRAHETWSLTHCSTLEDRPRYIPTDAFETFPFPFVLDTRPAAFIDKRPSLGDLEGAASDFMAYREHIMERESISLSGFHNRLNNPTHHDAIFTEARSLIDRLDQCVFKLYGWKDLVVSSYFTLDPCELDLDSDSVEAELAVEGQGEIRFASPAEATDFESRLRLDTGYRKRIPWRYRWEESIRDDVVSRLLTLCAEQYSSQADMGIRGKKSMEDAKPDAKYQSRANPSATFKLITSESYQPGLDLF